MGLNGAMTDARGLVVIVEDERAIAELQRLYLAEAGFGVHVERDGIAGLAAIRRLRPVAIVLDVGLPGLDGIEICRILGIELGADDYLTKPFSPRELVARMKALLRRQNGPESPAILTVGAVSIDLERRRVVVGETTVSLTSTEFDLLAKLASAPGRVFTREELLSSVWGQADYASGRTVDVHVAQVRAKLGPQSPIRTSRGVGYAAVDDLT
jgi:DNA-binding response OmpR family regulator